MIQHMRYLSIREQALQDGFGSLETFFHFGKMPMTWHVISLENREFKGAKRFLTSWSKTFGCACRTNNAFCTAGIHYRLASCGRIWLSVVDIHDTAAHRRIRPARVAVFVDVAKLVEMQG
jgi:hypothetical protein